MSILFKFYMFNEVKHIYQDGDYFCQLVEDKIIINELVGRHINNRKPGELSIVIG